MKQHLPGIFRYISTCGYAHTIYRLFPILCLVLTGCTLATVRSIANDQDMKAGFNAAAYVDKIWDSKLVPTIQTNAIDLKTLLAQIDKDKTAAITQYGRRSGTGDYSFMVKGDGKIIDVNTTSRAGVMNVDLPPYDGSVTVKIAIGPVITGNAIRDAVGFIQFNDFTNQLDFADVTRELNKRVSTNVIKQIDLTTAKDKALTFYGAFTLDDRQNIIITPISLEEKP